MKKISPEHEQEIILKYQDGLGSDSIAKIFSVTPTCILRILDRNGIKRRDFSRKLGNNHDEIIKLYESGLSAPDIADKFNVSHAAILKVLKKNNIKRRTAEECHRKYPIREDFFDKIDSEEKAYFLGFLYADGSNLKDANFVRIELAETDREILVKLAKLIYLEDPEYHVKNNDRGEKGKFCYLNINSKYICGQLEKLGCGPNKTFAIRYPEWLQDDLHQHFIRGYFDGDGCIYVNIRLRESSYIKITSNKIFAETFKNIIKKNIDVNMAVYLSNSKSSVFNATSAGDRQVRKITEWMYRNATIFMQRKYNKYLNLLAEIDKTNRLIVAGTRGYSKSILTK